MVDIPQVLGNIGKTGVEWLKNMTIPEIQQAKREREWQQQQALLDRQSALTRQSVLNRGNVDVANIRAAQDEKAALLKYLQDTTQPLGLREKASYGAIPGLTAEDWPREPGYGPRVIDQSKAVPMSPLNQADIGLKGAQTAEATARAGAVRPRAWAVGDPYPVNSLMSRGELSNVGQGRTGGLSFAPPDWQPTIEQFNRMAGASAPEATPKPTPTGLDYGKFGLDVAKAQRPETALNYLGEPFQRRPGIDLPLANSLFGSIPESAGLGGLRGGDATAAAIVDLRTVSPEDLQVELDYLGTPEGRRAAISRGVDPDAVLRAF